VVDTAFECSFYGGLGAGIDNCAGGDVSTVPVPRGSVCPGKHIFRPSGAFTLDVNYGVACVDGHKVLIRVGQEGPIITAKGNLNVQKDRAAELKSFKRTHTRRKC
jgi:hypothetical protein